MPRTRSRAKRGQQPPPASSPAASGSSTNRSVRRRPFVGKNLTRRQFTEANRFVRWCCSSEGACHSASLCVLAPAEKIPKRLRYHPLPRVSGELRVKSFFRIFRRIATPSRSAAILMVAPKTPLPAGPRRSGRAGTGAMPPRPALLGLYKTICWPSLRVDCARRPRNCMLCLRWKGGRHERSTFESYLER
jgi:hypothetical protein